MVNRSLESRIGDTQKLYGHSLNAQICQRAESYACHLKIYSPHLQNESKNLDETCTTVFDGTSLCVGGTETHFNTQSLINSCGGNCTDQFDYQDVQCSLLLPNLLGENPISEIADTFQDSLSKVYSACLQVFSPQTNSEAER